jgi:hypothetical protein
VVFVNLRVKEHELVLSDRYGSLLTLADLATILRYPSVQAVRQARLRGCLPVDVFQLPGRRGWFASAQSVARLLAELETVETERPEDSAMD